MLLTSFLRPQRSAKFGGRNFPQLHQKYWIDPAPFPSYIHSRLSQRNTSCSNRKRRLRAALNSSNNAPGQRAMKSTEWTTYRTRFLVKAKQLSSALSFKDHLGRQHCGRKGDYLVESSDGVLSITPRQIFEDIYVPMATEAEQSDAATRDANSTVSTNDMLRLGNCRLEALKIERIQDVSSPRMEDQRRSDHPRSSRTPRKSPQPIRASSSRLSLM